MGSGDERPPHPGAAPDPFEFPFEEAEAAKSAARALLVEVRAVKSAVETGMTTIEEGRFSGSFAVWFRGGSEELVEDLESRRQDLDDQVDAIEELISQAETDLEAYEEERREWQAAYNRWAYWGGGPVAVPV